MKKGLIPGGGYSHGDQFSLKSIIWLELYGFRNGVKIQHALNGGEFKVPGTGYRVDGYIAETNTILEFYGDYYHGCPIHSKKLKANINGVNAKERYAMTVERIVTLKNMGYNVIEMWECNFDWDMKHLLREEETFLENLEIVDRLDVRAGFYGGRTNALILYLKAMLNEEIRHYDVCSLYPAILKYGVYPVGHPEVITPVDHTDITQYFGIAKVKVRPPKNLLHPVLPHRVGGKLKFILCLHCAEKLNYGPCTCPDAAREWLGTYVTLELDEAVKNGYEIIKIYEVYHWKEKAQYCPIAKTGGLFTGYVNLFLKLKTEATGYPDWCATPQDKATFIENFYEKEGIRLDPDKMVYNSGLRAIAKAFLNNFWGRLGLRENLPRTKFISNVESFFEIVNDSSYVVNDFRVINDDTVALVYENHEDVKTMNTSTNAVLAAFTTCQGRLQLYKYMKPLGHRLAYTDTDCVIYLANTLKPHLDPPLGDYLGDLTSELKPGEYITELVSSGPKSYGFITNKGRTVCHLRGFTLNYQNSLLINFEVMKDMVLNQTIQNNPNIRSVVTVNKHKITRDKFQNKIYNRKEIKEYRAVYNKRVILDDLSTVPFGYDFSLIPTSPALRYDD